MPMVDPMAVDATGAPRLAINAPARLLPMQDLHR